MVTNTLNEKKLAPIHLATELNKVKALEVMGKYRNVIDIQQGKDIIDKTRNYLNNFESGFSVDRG